MLQTRVLSAILGGPILLYLIYKGSGFIFFLTAVLVLLALHEIFAMSLGLGVKAWRISGYVAGLLCCFGAYREPSRYLPFLIILWLIYCLARFVWEFPRTKLHDVSFNFLAVCYVSLLFSHLILLRELNQGVYLTFLAIALTWATDTGAYFVGRAMGRNKLAPLVSPNKTIEGAIGGLIFAVGVSLAVGYMFPNSSLSSGSLTLLGLAAGITGQLGDLVESAIKRIAGVKDSGKLIPGHGGVLDRFDSILFTVPTVYYLFLGLIIS
jgi:phosphatidate cytidylyltransferase